MSRTFGQWFRFLAACMAVGFMVTTMYASLGVTKDEVRNRVRMTVDFTVLPIVLPDGTEAPVVVEEDPTAIDGESSLPPDNGAPQAAAKPQPPAVSPKPAPKPKVAPEVAPKPVAAVSGPSMIESIRLTESGDSFTITVQANRPVGDTTYLNLSNPKRLVIDLRDKWKFHKRNVIRSKGAVKHIVIGEHKDRLRLVVHFNTPPKGQLAPQFKRSGNTLKVSVPLP